MDLTQVGTRLFFSRPEREERDTAQSTAVSAVLHLVIVGLLLFATRASVIALAGDEGVGTGIGAGAAGGGGGGGSDEQVSLLIPEPPPPAPEEPQVSVPEVMEITPPEITKPEEVAVAKADSLPKQAVPSTPTAGTGTGEGAGVGPGTGPGTGPGSGGGSGGGEGGGIGSGVGPGIGKGRVIPPSPEVLLIPPAPPGSVRGKTVAIRLVVDTIGVVTDAEIIPSTGDRKFDGALKRVALGWRFRAARNLDNRPVSFVFDVKFTF